MKKNILVILFISGCAFIDRDYPDHDNKFHGTDETLDIVSWNIENFPKIDSTIELLAPIIDSLNVDIIALQEITSSNSLNELTNQLSNWEAIIGPSHYGQRNAYLINTHTISNTNNYEILNDAVNEPFTKFPLVLEFTFSNINFIIINNHFKCCGDGDIDYGNYNDEEYRRLYAMELIKDYIDENHNTDNVIVLGDLNDELVDNENVFDVIIDDYENYLFTDFEIASGNSYYWSYPTYPSHIDHILITNELFDYEDTTATLFIDQWYFDGFNDYNTFISDHRPIAIRLNINP